MPYDRELDVSSFSKEWENDKQKLTVSVYSYNQGEKKLQISRENRNAAGELRFAKLGRMAKDEVEAILPLIQEAVAQMS
jgi:hypothetical protein